MGRCYKEYIIILSNIQLKLQYVDKKQIETLRIWPIRNKKAAFINLIHTLLNCQVKKMRWIAQPNGVNIAVEAKTKLVFKN